MACFHLGLSCSSSDTMPSLWLPVSAYCLRQEKTGWQAFSAPSHWAEWGLFGAPAHGSDDG